MVHIFVEICQELVQSLAIDTRDKPLNGMGTYSSGFFHAMTTYEGCGMILQVAGDNFWVSNMKNRMIQRQGGLVWFSFMGDVTNTSWLVVWLPFSIFPYIGLLIVPIDELIFFRGVAQPPTR